MYVCVQGWVCTSVCLVGSAHVVARVLIYLCAAACVHQSVCTSTLQCVLTFQTPEKV